MQEVLWCVNSSLYKLDATGPFHNHKLPIHDHCPLWVCCLWCWFTLYHLPWALSQSLPLTTSFLYSLQTCHISGLFTPVLICTLHWKLPWTNYSASLFMKSWFIYEIYAWKAVIILLFTEHLLCAPHYPHPYDKLANLQQWQQIPPLMKVLHDQWAAPKNCQGEASLGLAAQVSRSFLQGHSLVPTDR